MWRPSRPTVVFVGAVTFGLTLYEISEQAEVRIVGGRFVRTTQAVPKQAARHSMLDWTTQHYMPSGRLGLRASSPYESATWEKSWVEAVPGDLPKMFDTIAKVLEKAAPELIELVAEGEREEEERRRKYEEEEAQRLLEEAEQERLAIAEEAREDLLEVIAAWAEAKRIHDFFADVERRIADLDEPTASALREQLRHGRGGLAVQPLVSRGGRSRRRRNRRDQRPPARLDLGGHHRQHRSRGGWVSYGDPIFRIDVDPPVEVESTTLADDCRKQTESHAPKYRSWTGA
jgi:hypothetical protein